MHELKPCPFCGGKATISQFASGHYGNGQFTATYKVRCDDCKIGFVRESKFSIICGQLVYQENGYDECIELWNRRVSDENAAGN